MTTKHAHPRPQRGMFTRVLATGLCGLAVAAASVVPALADSPLPLGKTGAAGGRPAKVGTENKGGCSAESEQLIPQKPPVIADLGIEKAWQVSRGKVVVAVVDSGVAGSNVHFRDKNVILPGHDLVESGDGSTDIFAHGTAVAGQIAAREVEGSGLVGLAPESTILPVRVYVSQERRAADAALGPDPARTAAGITWAADSGAKVIVVPQSVPVDDPSLKNATAYATNKGALVVASTGNMSDVSEEEENAAPTQGDQEQGVARYPAGYPEALAVTAVDAAGVPSDAVIHGPHVDMAAPGMNVPTAYLGAGDCILAGDKPSSSYATGYVAAVAALVAAAYPGETPADWKYRILATALRPTRSQRDDKIGWGLVAPYDALTFTNDGTVPGPPNPRFPAPSPPEVPAMIPPTVQQDLRPERALLLGIIAGIGCLVTLAALTASRLHAQNTSRRKPRQ